MRYLTLIPLFLLFIAAPLRAVEYHGLYHAEVEVDDQGAEARAAGMQQAMADVLLKVSGTGRVLEDETLMDAMGSASRYVQQYRYRSEAIPPEEQQPDEAGKVAEERLLLSARFDQRSIDELLRQHGYTVWGDARPTTLIWLGVEQNGNRVLVGANDSGLVRELIDEEAKRRALPVKLPLLDLTDQSKVRAVDIWGDFLDNIEQASQRYAPQAILIGRLYPITASKWEVRWTLEHRGSVQRWQQQSSEIPELISGGIGHTAELLVQSFTQSYASGSGTIMLQVEGIDGLRQYRRVLDYLSGVHGVSSVIADRITPHSVRYRLQAEGGSDAVLQTIALGDVLEKAEPPVPQEPVPMVTLPRDKPAADETGQHLSGENADDTANEPDATTSAAIPPVPQQPVIYYQLIP